MGLLAHFAKGRDYREEYSKSYVAKLLLFLIDYDGYRQLITDGQDLLPEKAIEIANQIPKEGLECKLIHGSGKDKDHFEHLENALKELRISYEIKPFSGTPNVAIDLATGKVLEYTEKESEMEFKRDRESLRIRKEAYCLSFLNGSLKVLNLPSKASNDDFLNSIKQLVIDNKHLNYEQYQEIVIAACDAYIGYMPQNYKLYLAKVDAMIIWLLQPQAQHIDNFENFKVMLQKAINTIKVVNSTSMMCGEDALEKLQDVQAALASFMECSSSTENLTQMLQGYKALILDDVMIKNVEIRPEEVVSSRLSQLARLSEGTASSSMKPDQEAYFKP